MFAPQPDNPRIVPNVGEANERKETFSVGVIESQEHVGETAKKELSWGWLVDSLKQLWNLGKLIIT